MSALTYVIDSILTNNLISNIKVEALLIMDISDRIPILTIDIYQYITNNLFKSYKHNVFNIE